MTDFNAPPPVATPSSAAPDAGGPHFPLAGRSPPAARPIEFGGWLPAFKLFGNCGAHPQFAHTAEPPAGYCFVNSGGADSAASRPRRLWRRALAAPRVAAAAVQLALDCFRDGAGPASTLRFLLSRHLRSQLALPASERPVFITSVPFTLGQYPWVIEIEDTISLFFPFVHNGRTAGVNMAEARCFRPLRTLLEAPNCRAIVTHMKSTADSLPRLFDSAIVGEKTHHIPLGVALPPAPKQPRSRDRVELLFSNSWHQGPSSFYIRGGLDVLEAFAQVAPRHPRARLTLRTMLPEDLAPRYRRLIEQCGVRVLDRFMPNEEWAALREASHIYVLPSDRIHIVSVLQAMSYGMATIVSDGWGMQEYVDHMRTGWVAPGRYGKVTWCDEATGTLREEYSLMRTADPQMVARLAEAFTRLIEDEATRDRMGGAARAEVETRFNLENWNRGLQRIFDRSLPGEKAA